MLSVHLQYGFTSEAHNFHVIIRSKDYKYTWCQAHYSSLLKSHSLTVLCELVSV